MKIFEDVQEEVFWYELVLCGQPHCFWPSVMPHFLLLFRCFYSQLSMVLFFKATVFPQNPSELYIWQFESHLLRPFSLQETRVGNPFGREYGFTKYWEAMNASMTSLFVITSKLFKIEVHILFCYFCGNAFWKMNINPSRLFFWPQYNFFVLKDWNLHLAEEISQYCFRLLQHMCLGGDLWPFPYLF